MHVYRDLLPHLARYRMRYLLGGLCILSGIALKVWIPLLIGDAIEILEVAMDEASATDTSAERALVFRTARNIVLAAIASAFLRTTSRILILGNCRRRVSCKQGVRR